VYLLFRQTSSPPETSVKQIASGFLLSLCFTQVSCFAFFFDPEDGVDMFF
jgi:hypothetical protein